MDLKKKYIEEKEKVFSENSYENKKSFDVVDAEVKDMLNRYFEQHDVPFTWEAKILLEIVSHALYDQFSTHEEDVSALWEEIRKLKGAETKE